MTSEQALRRIRARIFDYPKEQQAQAERVLAYLKARFLRYREQQTQPVGPYSGMTRQELRQAGTCETDWY